MAETGKTAKLEIEGKTYELPIFAPSAGPNVIDIRNLYGQAGVFTYDPGFTSTASCDSTITFIDGGKGELLHRGYPIDQLAEPSSEVSSDLGAVVGVVRELHVGGVAFGEWKGDGVGGDAL